MEKCMDRMAERISAAPPGSAFVISDFTDLMSYETAKKRIAQLEKERKLRRVMRGVYDSPAYSQLLQEYAAPKPDEVARAIARSHNWRIAVSGDAALNLIGLSSQVPAHWNYISSGPYKSYKLGKTTICFLHRADRDITGMSESTILLIQALRALGKDNIHPDVMQYLARHFPAEDKKTILAEGRSSSAWIYEVIKKICSEMDGTC